MTMPPQDPLPELALLARMKQGDESAFVALYRRHKDAVYRLALLYCGSASQAADVTQDTFIHFIGSPGKYDPARGTLASWLCGIARNLARKAAGHREIATDPERFGDDAAPFEEHIERDTPLERLLRQETAELVRRALRAIAPSSSCASSRSSRMRTQRRCAESTSGRCARGSRGRAPSSRSASQRS